MKKNMKLIGFTLVLVLLVASLIGCGGGQDQPAEDPKEEAATTEEPAEDKEEEASSEHSGTVMMYSSMQEDQLIAIRDAFHEEYPDVKMEYYFAGTGKVITKIATEAQAGQVGADVIWVGDPADYASFKEENILQKYSSPEADMIDDAYIDPEGYYTGARMMNMGITYNTNLVTEDEAPTTWDDLLDPKWEGQVVLTDPNTSGTSKYWRNALMSHDDFGPEYIEKLRANGTMAESGTTATINQLAAGGYKLAVALDYVTESHVENGSPLAFVYPEETVSIFSPLGLVDKAKNEDNGKLLIDFILSKKGQEVLVENNLLSVRSDVDQGGVDVEAISEMAMDFDLADAVANEEENARKFNIIFGLESE